MLKSLYLKDFALFEEQEIRFGQGLTSLIGESGSGKSLILDAISSLMGGRCSSSNIRQGKDRYILQAGFDISTNIPVKEWLIEKGIQNNQKDLSISKELQRDGKSRIFVGESLVSLSLLREIGSLLCDIHNQNEQLFLLDKSNQLEFLDRFAGLNPLREEMRSAFNLFKSWKKKLTELEIRDSARKNHIESLEFQIRELDLAKLKPGEMEELEKEEKLLTHGEKLFENFKTISNHLFESEDSILAQFPGILASAEKITGIHDGFSSISQEFKEIYDRLKEIKTSVRNEEEEIFFSPERLDGVQSRLRELHRLKKKYDRDIDALIIDHESWKKELQTMHDSEESLDRIRKEYNSALNNIKILAMDLSKKRRSGLAHFEAEIQKELEFLGMKGARIQIVLRWEEDPDGELREGEKNYILTSFGLDQAEFYFTANAGEKPRPLRKVASGGEMSRIMLGIRSVLGQTHTSQKLLIFDEIDAGVGGEGAFSMAQRLGKLSEISQILVITHSQPIAAVSTAHWKVEKFQKDGRTISKATSIASKNKPIELARMVAGKEVTEAAVAHARFLLEKKAS
ncbi:DNA repair protein RecN [Leptospira sp. GIMC2001]|uniref:DNA repair protein RecN n=1 Tax=Leptospira sp. GIMC2001 TaxID=1513297 RepID=UPI00234B579C|nr:DNA repair protein RecN [Leptospira sp. GIMC2001]WCL47890.1 DNA repair protein RecN [Leptospira sp. GIMC2001]